MRHARLINLLAFIFMLNGCSLLDAFVEQQASEQADVSGKDVREFLEIRPFLLNI